MYLTGAPVAICLWIPKGGGQMLQRKYEVYAGACEAEAHHDPDVLSVLLAITAIENSALK